MKECKLVFCYMFTKVYRMPDDWILGVFAVNETDARNYVKRLCG